MGTGKTLPTIEMLETAREQISKLTDSEALWMIGPKTAIRSWEYELNKWKSPVKPKLIVNSPQGIDRAMTECELPPFALVVDEASYFKNPSTKRWKLVNTLTSLMAATWKGQEYVVCLTGTPAPRDPTNWWGLCELARPGWIAENNVNKFRARLAILQDNEGPHGSYKQVVGWNLPELQLLPRRLSGLVLVKMKSECLDLPEKQYQTVQLGITPDVMRAAVVIYESCSNALTAMIRLRELSDGFYSQEVGRKDNGDPIYEIHRVDTPKDQALRDILEDFTNNDKTRIVIYAGFTESVDRIVNLCIDAGWGVIRVDGRGWHAMTPGIEASQAQFQDKDLDKPIAFVGNALSGGMAVTLTASDTIVYYSNSFDGTARMQSEDRIHRIGTKGANIVDLLHLPTDKQVLDNLSNKRDLQAVTLGDIGEALKRVELSTL
jgi:SNF2 family DNA or RNA helicase